MPEKPVYKFGAGWGVICTRGYKRKACLYCSRTHEILCDYPVGRTKKGKLRTCDAPLCPRHAQSGVSEDVHFCRRHYGPALAAYKRRLAAKKLA